MVTKSKVGIFKSKAWLSLGIDLDKAELRSHKDALLHPKWKQAMVEEYEALIRNQTLSLVPLPHNRKIIGNKWVFRLKKPSRGFDRYKARSAYDYSNYFDSCPV